MSFCGVLIDEWRRAGMTDAVVAPGSRSTPLVVALIAEPRVRVHVVLDERSASYTALGIALASGRPVALVCTSGTAATHFHGAVVEASQAGIPLLVCTADRPPELQDVGAPQTITQRDLYGSAVRWACDAGVADPATATHWRSLAARAWCEAVGTPPGPVHLNLMFREPLVGDEDDSAPPGRPNDQPWHRAPHAPCAIEPDPWLADLLAQSVRPLVVAGAGSPPSLALHDVPVLSDHRAPYPGTIAHWDSLLRAPSFADAHRPDLVLCTGSPPASKVLARWLDSLDVPRIVVTTTGRWVDPTRRASAVLAGDLAATVSGSPAWIRDWTGAADDAGRTIDRVLADHAELVEPGIARTVLASAPTGSTIVASSSMPIRDLEGFASPRGDVRVLANRGANGIDGVTSTAIGVALTGAPTVLLIGDLAFLHDAGALLGLGARQVALTIVVVDNDGGGIFSFLPQHDVLPSDQFERFYGTPHGIDLVELAQAHRLPARAVSDASTLATAVGAVGESGVRVVIARTRRDQNVAVHEALHAAVADAWRDG